MVCNNTKRASLFHTKQTTPDAPPVVGDPNPMFRLQTFKVCGSVYVFHFTHFIRKSELVVLRSILFIKYDSNYQITEDMWRGACSTRSGDEMPKDFSLMTSR